jgi:hypothetical protein
MFLEQTPAACHPATTKRLARCSRALRLSVLRRRSEDGRNAPPGFGLSRPRRSRRARTVAEARSRHPRARKTQSSRQASSRPPPSSYRSLTGPLRRLGNQQHKERNCKSDPALHSAPLADSNSLTQEPRCRGSTAIDRTP